MLVIAPPPVRGIGTGGGFKMMVQDRANAGPKALEAATVGDDDEGQRRARPDERLHALQYRHAAAVRRHRPREGAATGRRPADVFSTLETYLGSSYINDFNLFGRTWRVTAQADAPFRHQPSDIVNLKTLGERDDGADRLGRHPARRQRAVPRRTPQPLSGGRAAGRYQARLLERGRR